MIYDLDHGAIVVYDDEVLTVEHVELEVFAGKPFPALGVLQTIGTLILTLESTPDVLLHIESVLMPVIQITLENKLYGEEKKNPPLFFFYCIVQHV